MMIENDSFPRGNRVTTINKTVKRQYNDNLFATEKPPKTKKPRKEKKIEKFETPTENAWQDSLKLGGTLTYAKLQTGMVILACIKRITNLALQVELPGFTYASISIKDISDAFTNELTRKLKEKDSEEPLTILNNLFKLGTLVPVKIQHHEYKDEDGHEVHASINPKDVNSEKTFNSFKKGSTIWVNIVSELDHGYELSVGVKNCRVFLPHKNVPQDKKYQIGEPLFCIVHKFEQVSNVTTLTVSAKKEHLEKIDLKDDVYLQNIIPGTKVELLVEQVLPHGIKGTFLDNCFGYLDESQMFSLYLNKVKEASTLPVYVLYIEPITKVTYLTLHNFDVLPGADLEVGTVTNSEVVSIRPNGLCLKIGKSKGYITNKRLLNSLSQQSNVDDIRKKFPIGTKSVCRILDFNRMEQLYVCTFEKKVVKEKIFSTKDLELAQPVTVRITKIVPTGFVVNSGLIQGFIPNLHISDSKFSENLKSKYAVGITVKARVLNLPAEGNPIFTMKKSLVDSDKCLTSLENIQANAQFVGIVVHTRPAGALVAFYGGITGWIRSKDLNPGSYTNPRDYFFRGQAVNVFIIGFSGEKLLLGLHAQTDRLNKKIKVGNHHKVKVVEATDKGVAVEIGRMKIPAFVPVHHLSSNLQYCKLLLENVRKGYVLTDLTCLSNKGVPVLSRSEFMHFKKNGAKVKKFEDLKKGFILRCYFQRSSEEGIIVSTLLKDYDEEILIPTENLIQHDGEYEKYDCILTKIVKIDQKSKKLDLCVILDEPEKLALDATINRLEQMLEDRMRIIKFGHKNNWNLVEYKLGQKIDCKISKIEQNGECTVTLPNGIKGRVRANLKKPNLVKNATVEGVVLDYNFTDNYVEICLKQSFKEKINEMQSRQIVKEANSSVFGDLLLTTDLYILGILRDTACQKQFMYLPRRFSENAGEIKLKVVLKKVNKSRIVAVPKRVWLAFEKEKEAKKRLKLKRKAQEQTKLENESSEEEEEEESSDGSEEEQDSDENVENEDDLSEDDEIMQLEDDETEDIEMSNDEESEDETKTESKPIPQETGPLLSGVQSFFGAEDASKAEDSSSSDDEEEVDLQRKKKKKLTPAERLELAKQEEERISKIEKELADASTTPQSAEQFDRLLLANPNSSELWLKFIAMHVAMAEMDKARAVGKRALETINMTLVQEKFNIWVALLNLENMYGTKETFDQLFDEAVKFNDSLEIYLTVIKMLASAGKLNEMEEKIKKVRAKEKQNIKMWLELGQVYYSLGDFKSARNIKEAALKSIQDNKRQFDLIVKFGIMEFQSGELEQAIANFETIVETFPAKVNIWTIYVDQLIKKDKIALARKLLERAVNQKFTLKNMKVLFQKYLSFEEKYGTPESAKEVKQRAADYVKSVR